MKTLLTVAVALMFLVGIISYVAAQPMTPGDGPMMRPGMGSTAPESMQAMMQMMTQMQAMHGQMNEMVKQCQGMMGTMPREGSPTK